MKRSELREIARKVGKEQLAKGYGFWCSVGEPVTFDRIIGKTAVQIEINVVERNDEYVQIGISASDGRFWSSCCPPGISFVIERSGTRRCQNSQSMNGKNAR